MSNFGFSKQHRLLSAADFKQVFDHANLKASSPAMLLLAAENQVGWPRIGFVIAKKHVRLAVSRNRIKRLLREYFRLNAQQLPAIDLVVIARKGVDKLDNQDVSATFAQLCKRLARAHEKIAAGNLE